MEQATMNTRHRRDRTTDPLPQIGFIRLPQVLHILGISKTAFYSGIQNGVYPSPKKLTSRTAVWSVAEIREFVQRIEQQQ